MIGLIGLPGSGKSTLGRQLARRLGVPFADSDLALEQRLGCSIRRFFEREGEAAFRDAEEAILAELTQAPQGVLSTGGGVVLRPANRQRLHGCGHVVYLHCTPEEAFRRLRRDQTRPLLQVADPLGRLRGLYAERDPLYRETAHCVLEAGRASIAALAGQIMSRLRPSGAPLAAPAATGS